MFEVEGCAVAVGSQYLHAAAMHVLHSCAQLHAGDDRQVEQAAHSRAHHLGVVDVDGPRREDYRVGSKRIGAANHSAGVAWVSHLGADHYEASRVQHVNPEAQLATHGDDALRGDRIGDLPHGGFRRGPHPSIEASQQFNVLGWIVDDHLVDDASSSQRFSHCLAAFDEKFAGNIPAAALR